VISSHLHLVSDATGETVISVARACLVQFEGIVPSLHNWTLVRTRGQIDKVISGIHNSPGPVLYTLLDAEIRRPLEEACGRLGLPCVPVLDPVMHALGKHFERGAAGLPGRQHVLDQDYFDRIDAMNFALAHDDGQLIDRIEEAQVVLVGVSRTSKTPTSLYLANRRVRAANVPIVPDVSLPSQLLRARKPLIVGLTKAPERLVDLRRSRLRMMGDVGHVESYADLDAVTTEVANARKLFARMGWPVIDVTRRSIEETAATILNLLGQRSNTNSERVAE